MSGNCMSNSLFGFSVAFKGLLGSKQGRQARVNSLDCNGINKHKAQYIHNAEEAQRVELHKDGKVFEAAYK